MIFHQPLFTKATSISSINPISLPALCNLYLGYRSQFLGLGSSSQFFDPEFQVLGTGSWVSGPGFLVFGFQLPVLVLKVPSLYYRDHSIIITKCDKKLLQSVTGITKWDSYCKVRQKITTNCDRYYRVRQKVITKCDGYYNEWQLSQSET